MATTIKHHTAEVEQVAELEWTWVPDMSHPHNQEIGFYTAHLSDGAYGWYTKEGHPVKCRPEGDSRRRWEAAQTILSAWN